MDVKPWTVDVTEAVNLVTSAANVLSYKALMSDESGKWVEPPESQSGYFIVSSNLVYYDILCCEDDYSFLLPTVLDFLFNSLFAFWLTIVCCCCITGAIAVKLILICVYGVMERKGGHELLRGQMSGMSVVEMVQPVAVNNHHRLLPTDDLDSVVSPVHVPGDILQQ